MDKAVLFDLDGTLVDSGPGILAALEFAFSSTNLIAEFEKTPIAVIRTMLGPRIEIIVRQIFAQISEEELKKVVGFFREYYDSKGFKEFEVYPQAHETLEMLAKRGYSLFIVTNKPKLSSLNILSISGLDRHFELVITSDYHADSTLEKAQMAEYLLSLYPMNLENTYLVGDQKSDITAAIEHSMQPVFADYGYGELSSLGALEVKVISGLEELSDLCK